MATVKHRKARQKPSRTEIKRRQEIIEATTRSIVKNGLCATTLASVSKEAGLSDGVAVFYFKTKMGLLTEVLRHRYVIYQAAWLGAYEAAGPHPLQRLLAILRSDFDPEICSIEALIVWQSFWGEVRARPHYKEVLDLFDGKRVDTMQEVCADLLRALGRPVEQAKSMSVGIDSMVDGLWLRLYLAEGDVPHVEALEIAFNALAAQLPECAEEIAAELERVRAKQQGDEAQMDA